MGEEGSVELWRACEWCAGIGLNVFVQGVHMWKNKKGVVNEGEGGEEEREEEGGGQRS